MPHNIAREPALRAVRQPHFRAAAKLRHAI